MQEKMMEMMRKSLNDNVGITLFLSGKSVPLLVVEIIGTEAVVGRNQEFSEVLIRMDKIIGCALS